MLVLSRNDVRTCLDMPTALQSVRAAFEALGHSQATMPQRLVTSITEHAAAHLSMPCYVSGDEPILSLKAVTFFPHNPSRGSNTTHAVMIVHDPATGAPLAMLDGELLTSIRTGAVSGLATDLIARKDSSKLGLVGTGEVGYWQIAAVCAVRAIASVVVGARDAEKAERFCARVRKDFAIDCRFEKDLHRIPETCDVICLATTSMEPVLFGADVKPGTHVNGVGSFSPKMIEADKEFVRNARVTVDLVTAAKTGAGELIAAAGENALDWSSVTELSQLVLSLTRRSSDEDVTYFKSVGLAVQDAFCAKAVLTKASELELGTHVDIE